STDGGAWGDPADRLSRRGDRNARSRGRAVVHSRDRRGPGLAGTVPPRPATADSGSVSNDPLKEHADALHVALLRRRTSLAAGRPAGTSGGDAGGRAAYARTAREGPI